MVGDGDRGDHDRQVGALRFVRKLPGGRSFGVLCRADSPLVRRLGVPEGPAGPTRNLAVGFGRPRSQRLPVRRSPVTAAKQVRATTSFACTVGEVEYLVHSGEVLPATHPVVKASPELFEPVEAE